MPGHASIVLSARFYTNVLLEITGEAWRRQRPLRALLGRPVYPGLKTW
jgi:hypothetical protein